MRPAKRLVGFSRLHLAPGERKVVTFTLHTSQLGGHEEGAGYIVRPGKVEVLAGNSSEHLPLSGAFEIAGQPTVMDDSRAFFSRVSY